MKRALIAIVVCALAGCGKKDKAEPAAQGSSGSGSAAGSAPVPGPAIDAAGAGSAAAADAAPAEPASDDPEEAARRKDKKTGLGAADEKPEVVVEELVRAIGTGKAAVDRFIDPKRGVVERLAMPGGGDKPLPETKRRLCGDAAKETGAYFKRMVEAEVKGKADEVHQIACSNAFAAADDPAFGADEMGDTPKGAVPMKHVSCGAPGAGEYDEIYNVEWVPDPERGFRIAAIVSTEGGAITGKLWSEVAKEIAGKKGCK